MKVGSARGSGSAALCGTATSLLHGIATHMVWVRRWDEPVLETCGEVGTCKYSAQANYSKALGHSIPQTR